MRFFHEMVFILPLLDKKVFMEYTDLESSIFLHYFLYISKNGYHLCDAMKKYIPSYKQLL